MLELHEADGAFDRARAVARRRSCRDGDERRRLPRLRPVRAAAARPGAAAARAVPAAAPRGRDRPEPSCQLGTSGVHGRRVGADLVDRRRTRRRSRPCARRSRGGTSTRSNLVQHLSAPFERRPRRARGGARAASAAASAAARRATAGRSSRPRPSSSSRGAATGCGRCRSRARARPARTSTTRRTRPST